jgi:hypothetical protein
VYILILYISQKLKMAMSLWPDGWSDNIRETSLNRHPSSPTAGTALFAVVVAELVQFGARWSMSSIRVGSAALRAYSHNFQILFKNCVPVPPERDSHGTPEGFPL